MGMQSTHIPPHSLTFSASSDNTIRKWSMTPPFACVGELCSAMSGDILSLAAHGDYIYAGFQVWISLYTIDENLSLFNGPFAS